MTALLARLADSGLAVTVKGGGLQIKPKARLTDTLRAEIKAHTAALVECLTAQAERLPVTLFSERLGDSLVLAPDGTPELQIGGMAVYTPTETGLLHTAGVSDGMLAAVHNVKKVFGGTVISVQDAPRRSGPVSHVVGWTTVGEVLEEMGFAEIIPPQPDVRP